MAAISNDSPATQVANSINDGKKHLILAASGSVATIKIPLIVAALANYPKLSIRIVLTTNASRFLAGQSAEQPNVAALARLANVDGVYMDVHEWTEPWTRGAKILHIELRRWAHLLVIAPMSANLLGHIANGLCDSLLTNLVRAWETDPSAGKKIVVAPAMNTYMWTHPITARQISLLANEWEWFEVLGPQEKLLACHDVGQGGMVEWTVIVEAIQCRLGLKS